MSRQQGHHYNRHSPGEIAVAAAVARKLDVKDFDIVILRKLIAPDNSENAISAVMHDGSVYLDDKIIQSKKISNDYLELEKSEQRKEIDRRIINIGLCEGIMTLRIG